MEGMAGTLGAARARIVFSFVGTAFVLVRLSLDGIPLVCGLCAGRLSLCHRQEVRVGALHFKLRYVSSFHWSLAQFLPSTTNIAPVHGLERLYAVLAVLLARLGVRPTEP